MWAHSYLHVCTILVVSLMWPKAMWYCNLKYVKHIVQFEHNKNGRSFLSKKEMPYFNFRSQKYWLPGLLFTTKQQFILWGSWAKSNCICLHACVVLPDLFLHLPVYICLLHSNWGTHLSHLSSEVWTITLLLIWHPMTEGRVSTEMHSPRRIYKESIWSTNQQTNPQTCSSHSVTL